uniref:C-type lectin domain-containing protein n=1 Tax=Sphaeramia orbicularis TaxID=375764 RepID=A0A673B8A0_9TELE
SIVSIYVPIWSISTCLLHQYHYVHELKTWTEAQSYCRRHYTDLATIENSSEVDQLINAVSGESVSEVWIGLFSEVDWRWSDGYTGNESGYRRWDPIWSEPDFEEAAELCVTYHPNGWRGVFCEYKFPFICYSGTEFVYVNLEVSWTAAQSYCRRHYTDLATIENSSEMDQLINAVSDKSVSEVWIGLFSEVDWRWSDGYTGNESGYTNWKFVYINQSLSWTAAQSYCRSNYVDLATVKNPSDEQKIQNVTPSGSSAWIGLFRNPNFNWSDGSSFSFTYWYGGSNPLGSSKIICGVTSLENSGTWSEKESMLHYSLYSHRKNY